jgi:hypothetical protein
MSGRIYGREVFSPKFISIQILTLVSSYYATYTTFLISLSLLTRFEIPRFIEPFSDNSFDPFDSMLGLSNVIAQTFTTVLLSWVLKIVVERSSKVLDFVFTVHLVNLLLTWILVGFPKTVSWWIVHGFAVGLSTVGGRTLCRREESADIVLSNLERE